MKNVKETKLIESIRIMSQKKKTKNSSFLAILFYWRFLKFHNDGGYSYSACLERVSKSCEIFYITTLFVGSLGACSENLSYASSSYVLAQSLLCSY